MNAPALVMALFNGAWQGMLLCLAVLGILRLYRGLNAATRYAIWSAVLGIVLILPIANYAFSVRPVMQTETYTVIAPAPQLVHVQQGKAAKPSVQLPPTQPREIAPKLQPYQLAVHELAGLAQYARFALYALALLALIRLAILGREIARMIASRSAVAPIAPPFALRDSVRRPYAFAASSGASMPCVLGFQPALIVIPDVLLGSEQHDELLSVVLHEHEHVMRFDDVQNVLHRLSSAIGFFLPGVHLALRELAVYREQICDDAAIAGMGNRYAYARTLSTMAAWMQSSPTPVPCFIFKRKQLLRRIEVLLDAAVSHSLRPNLRFAALTIAALAAIAIVTLRWQVPVFAERVTVVRPKMAARPITVARARVAPRIAARIAPKIAPTIVKATRAKTLIKKSAITNCACPKIAPAAKKIQGAPLLFAPVARAMIHAHLHAHLAARLAGDTVIAPPRLGQLAEEIARRSAMVPPARNTDLLDALSKAGYNNLSVDDLIALRDHGVSAGLIEASGSYFGQHLNVGDLVYLADHGVSGIYLSELSAAGIRGLQAADVVKMFDHGVGAMSIAAARVYFGTINSTDLVTLVDNGVSAAYLMELHAAGVRGLKAGDVVRLMDHGVSPGLVSGLHALGYNPSVEDIVRLADHGVTMQYVESLRRLGNRHLSIDDIIRLHDAGF